MQRIKTGCWVPLCPKALVCTWEGEVSINLLDGFEGKRGFVQRNNSLSRSVWCSRRPELLLWCFGKAWDEAGPSRGRSWVMARWELWCPWDIAAPASVWHTLLLPWSARLPVYLPGEAQYNEDGLFQLRIQNVFILVLLVCMVLHLSWEGLLLGLETSLPSACLLNNIFSVLTQVVGFSLFLLINVCRSYNLLCVMSSHTDCALLTWLSR